MTVLKKIFKVFEHFDFFSSSIQLKINSKERYPTPLGALVSITIIIFTCVSLIQMLIDMFSGKGANVTFKTE